MRALGSGVKNIVIIAGKRLWLCACGRGNRLIAPSCPCESAGALTYTPPTTMDGGQATLWPAVCRSLTRIDR